MSTFKNLQVWKSSIDLAIKIYQSTSNYPLEDKYGLSSQMRRASVSIASNIAEGTAMNKTTHFIHYLHLAFGSLNELKTQLTISQELDYLNDEKLFDQIDHIGKMLFKLIQHHKNT